jgi:hypothetical protein
MPAHVEEGMDFAFGITAQKDGVFPHIGSYKVVGLRNLRLMPYKKPTAAEYLLKLLLVDLIISKDPSIDQAPFGVDQSTLFVHGGYSLSIFATTCSTGLLRCFPGTICQPKF